jgi:hypothetical protein
MKNKHFLLLLLVSCVLVFPGCLTCDIVTYVFTMTSGNSGTVKMSYRNITSSECSEQDFINFFDTIINGNGIEKNWPAVTNIRKNFFEENGKLNADITMDFSSPDQVGLYQYKGTGPLMFMYWTAPFIGLNGHYLESNGTFGGEKMPVVFWEPKQKELTLSVQIPDTLQPIDEGQEVNCLVEKFREHE